MRKLILLLVLCSSVAFSQKVRNSDVATDAAITATKLNIPSTALKYLNGYGQWVALGDSLGFLVRLNDSLALYVPKVVLTDSLSRFVRTVVFNDSLSKYTRAVVINDSLSNKVGVSRFLDSLAQKAGLARMLDSLSRKFGTNVAVDSLSRKVNRGDSTWLYATQFDISTKQDDADTSAWDATYGNGSDSILIPRVGTPTYRTLTKFRDLTSSAGTLIDTAYIAKIDTGRIKVFGGKGVIRTSNSQSAPLVSFEWAESTSVTIPTDSVRYVGVEYNSGSPRVTIRSSFNWNWNTDFPLGKVFHVQGDMYVLKMAAHTEDVPNYARQFLRQVLPFSRTNGVEGGGIILGETGTRNLTLSSGKIWHGFNYYNTSTINTSTGDKIDMWWRNGAGGWRDSSLATNWNNLLYDDNSGTLATLTTNRYGVHWVYLDISTNKLHLIVGRGNYTSLTLAEAETEPSTVPIYLLEHGLLVGRITFQKSGAAAVGISSPFTTHFTPTAISNHSALSNLDYASSGHTGFLGVADSTLYVKKIYGSSPVRMTGNAGTVIASLDTFKSTRTNVPTYNYVDSLVSAVGGDITAVNVTSPITGGGTSGAVTIGITSPLPIANGGTNNTTAQTNGIPFYDGSKFSTDTTLLKTNRNASDNIVTIPSTATSTLSISSMGTGYSSLNFTHSLINKWRIISDSLNSDRLWVNSAAGNNKLIMTQGGFLGLNLATLTLPIYDLQFGSTGTGIIGMESKTAGGTGDSLTVQAGTTTDGAGGTLSLSGGNAGGADIYNGGNVYVFGGSGIVGGAYGHTVLAHNGASINGNVGIGKVPTLGTANSGTLNIAGDLIFGTDPADAGDIRLENANNIAWEASPAGTDVTMGADASEIIQITGGTLDGGDLTANSVNATQIDETAAYAFSSTSNTVVASYHQDGSADPADAGAIRLGNAVNIAWEASPASTDVTLTANSSEVITSSVPISATTGFQIGGAAAAGQILIGNGTNFVATSPAYYYGADAGANDTYTASLTPAPTAYVTGQMYVLKANTANTGAASINFNSLGAKTIVKAVSTTLANNDILAGMICLLIYDGTNMVLMNPRAL